MTDKERIDTLLVQKGFFPSRERAQRAIMAGAVRIDGELLDKPGTKVDVDSVLTVDEGTRYVSRGAEKLKKALLIFNIDVNGKICLDTGASTGGFTEVLLENGAAKVICVDVGYGQLAWKLRQDERVVVLERTNVRYLEKESLQGPVDIVTADLSFISLKKVLGNLIDLSAEEAEFILLIKPQFEAGRDKVGKGGIVKDPEVHKQVLRDLIYDFEGHGLYLVGVDYSPIKGADGNIEFLVHLTKGDQRCKGCQGSRGGRGGRGESEVKNMVDKVVDKAHEELDKKC